MQLREAIKKKNYKILDIVQNSGMDAKSMDASVGRSPPPLP